LGLSFSLSNAGFQLKNILSFFYAEFGDEAVTAYSPRLAALATSSAAYTTLSDDAGTGTIALLGIIYLFFIFISVNILSYHYFPFY